MIDIPYPDKNDRYGLCSNNCPVKRRGGSHNYDSFPSCNLNLQDKETVDGYIKPGPDCPASEIKDV